MLFGRHGKPDTASTPGPRASMARPHREHDVRGLPRPFGCRDSAHARRAHGRATPAQRQSRSDAATSRPGRDPCRSGNGVLCTRRAGAGRAARRCARGRLAPSTDTAAAEDGDPHRRRRDERGARHAAGEDQPVNLGLSFAHHLRPRDDEVGRADDLQDLVARASPRRRGSRPGGRRRDDASTRRAEPRPSGSEQPPREPRRT